MISVVIPTYNRLEKLKKTLLSCQRQTLAKKDFEVIVVDDGGSDGAADFMAEFIKNAEINIKYFYLSHQGPALARNYGVKMAQGAVIFFCGDDTLLEKNLLAIHARHHLQISGTALLGIILWSHSEPVAEFMRYLAPAGPQFHYNTIKNKNDAGFDHFYTCNISLEKKWLKQVEFDTRFVHAAFEDIDLGLRLENRGLKIIFNPEAKVYHSHYYDEENFGSRMERVGRSAIIFFSKYEKHKKILHILKRKYAPFSYFPGIKIFNCLSALLAASRLIKKINIKYHWFWLVCLHYTAGMLKQLADKDAE